MTDTITPTLWAVSDLHVGHRGNREPLELLHPEHPDDWLIVAGDVGERIAEIREVLELLRSRFAVVLWVPGNHELWTTAKDPVQLRGRDRYEHLVRICRELDILTPEDPFPLFAGVRIAPMFVLYDYSWRPEGIATTAEALRNASDRGVVATDEYMLYPDPYPSRQAWARERIRYTRARLDALDPEERTVLINHWPLVREPTRVLWYPEFALWCGTDATADWHLEYRAECCVYGHLHIPRTSWYGGVRFEECSVGYPREWKMRGMPDPLMRRILPAPEADQVGWRRLPDGTAELYGTSVKALTPEKREEMRVLRERMQAMRERRERRRR